MTDETPKEPGWLFDMLMKDFLARAPNKAEPPREPYFRAVVVQMEGEETVAVRGVRCDEDRVEVPPVTFAELLTGLWGASLHDEGNFPTIAEAVAHALTLPLIDPSRTVTILRLSAQPELPPPPPRAGRVH